MNTPASSLLLHDIAALIRQYAHIWHIQHLPPEGMLFRCEMNHIYFRVFIPRYEKADAQMPLEKGVLSHFVTSLNELQSWILTIRNNGQ